MTTSTGIGYKGEVHFQVAARARRTAPISLNNLTIVRDAGTTLNHGTPLLYQAMANFLLYGSQVSQARPQYIDIGAVEGTKFTTILNRRLSITAQPGSGEEYTALFSTILRRNDILLPTQPVEGQTYSVRLYASSQQEDLLAETGWQAVKLEAGQSLLIEWQLGFVDVPASGGGNN